MENENVKRIRYLSIQYTVSNVKAFDIQNHHAIFMESSNVTFSEEKVPINKKVLSKDQKQ